MVYNYEDELRRLDLDGSPPGDPMQAAKNRLKANEVYLDVQETSWKSQGHESTHGPYPRDQMKVYTAIHILGEVSKEYPGFNELGITGVEKVTGIETNALKPHIQWLHDKGLVTPDPTKSDLFDDLDL